MKYRIYMINVNRYIDDEVTIHKENAIASYSDRVETGLRYNVTYYYYLANNGRAVMVDEEGDIITTFLPCHGESISLFNDLEEVGDYLYNEGYNVIMK